MGAAAQWERENAADLQAIADAMANKDPYLAEEIRQRVAPVPECGHARESKKYEESQFGWEVEIIDPETGQRDNQGAPAVVKNDGTRKWYRAGMLHNSKGPAVIKANGDVEYYYLGTKCKSAEDLDATVECAAKHAKTSTNWRNVG